MTGYHHVSPFPDEELGSVVTRAARQVGLPANRFARFYLNAPEGTRLAAIDDLLLPMSALTGLPARDLLLKHTLVPYGLAGLPRGTSRSILKSLLGGRRLADPPMLGRIVRHWCPACVRDDIATYGASYWHRQHLLPGVAECARHRCALLHATEFPPHMDMQRAVKYWIRGVMPDELSGVPFDLPASASVTRQLIQLSKSALRSGNSNLPCADVPLDTLRQIFGPKLLHITGATGSEAANRPLTTIRILSIIALRAEARKQGRSQLELWS